MTASTQQVRSAGIVLFLVAALTSVLIANEFVDGLSGRILLPVFLAYILFNVGFVFAVAKSRLRTKNARFGLAAVSLNFGAMLLSDFNTVWISLSVAAVVMALIAGYLLLVDDRASAA